LGINPYKRGVAIDISSKPTQMLIQLQQKEQAKNEALDKYFMDYDKNITPAGMRNIDIEGLMKRKNEAKQYYFQNKEAIRRPELDNGRAYSQFMGMNTDQLGFVSKSKEQTGKAKALSTATMNANQKKQIIADGVKDALILNELALDDPRRVDFDIANFRAYDAYDDKKFMENVWGKEELPTKIVNKDIGNGKFIPETYHLKIPEMAQLAPQRLQSAEISTRSYVRNNEGAIKYFNTLMEDPIMLKEANKAYQEYKGPNAKIVDEEDFAVAYGLLKKPGGFVKAGKEEETAAYKRQQDLNKSIAIKNIGDGVVAGGNILDSIGGDGTPVSLGKDKFGNQYKIEYGQVLGKDDQPFTGVSDIKGTDLPAELFSILAKSGTKLYAADNFKIRSEDGIITEIASPRGKVTRGFIENAQLTADKEPVKGQRLVYGKPVKPISASKKAGAGINWKK
jgi:hypothetical protein